MSTNPLQTQSCTKCLVRPATQADWEDPRLLRNYFDSAAPGIGRDLEVSSLQSLLNRDLQPPVLVGLFAEAADDAIAGLRLEDKPWDTAMLSARVRNLTLLASANSQESRYQIASRLAAHCLENYPDHLGDCVFTRIPSDDAALLSALEEIGFHVLVPMVTLGKDGGGYGKQHILAGIELGDVRPEDIDQVGKIAATAFHWGRFTADFRVPRDAAERLHSAWARNCCLGSHANRVLVARDNHEVLGFIALKFQRAHEVQLGSIELVAVSETSRGRGLGAILVRQGCEWLSRFTKHVIVRTELPNTAALRMYEAQGFRILNGSLYLSRWRPAAA